MSAGERKPYRVENWGDAGATTTVFLTVAEADIVAYVVERLTAEAEPYAPTLTIEEAK